MDRHSNIAVIGAGLMGHGIALNMAEGGNRVRVYDPDPQVLEQLSDRVIASLMTLGIEGVQADVVVGRIETETSVGAAVVNADVVFEAAPEKLELKQDLFAEIEQYAPEDAILASNTSVIQITRIMEGLTGRHRALGTHWWNPPHLIPLVEIIKTTWTDNSAVQQMHDLLESAHKTPVIVEKDVPGFIGNRLQHALWREAISLVENGICDAQAVDTVIKSSFGRRLAVLGPLENADLVGTDLTLDIHENVLFDLESQKEPSGYLRKLVEEGRHGMKTGEGFRKWTQEDANAVRERVGHHLVQLAGILAE